MNKNVIICSLLADIPLFLRSINAAEDCFLTEHHTTEN